MVDLSPFEKKLIALVSQGIPLVARPYHVLAQRLGCTEKEVIATLKKLLSKKIIRRFGATVRQNRSGYQGNVMVAWKVPAERLDEVGNFCARLHFVTHCYVRQTSPDWPYNFYTMVHAADEKECKELVTNLAKELKLKDYVLLFTEKEIVRKTRPYFPELLEKQT